MFFYSVGEQKEEIKRFSEIGKATGDRGTKEKKIFRRNDERYG